MDKREVKQQQQQKQQQPSISESRDLESPATSSYHNHPADRETNSPADGSPDYSPARSSVSSLSSLSNGSSSVKHELQQQQQPQKQQQQSPIHGFVSPQLHPLQNLPPEPPSPVSVVNRYVVEEPVAIKKTDRGARDGFVRDLRSEEVVSGGGGSSASNSGGGRRRRAPAAPAASGAVSRTERVGVAKKAALGFRVFEVLFCLVSLSVMAADKNQGWALDSFYRYKEFRYCIAVNVIGFAYAALQGCDLAYQLASGNYYTKRRGVRLYLDFFLDQMVAYLLISASSSAATRVDDWQSNWGKDKFPEMATASVGLSFVAFVAFAFSSLISGYLLCTLNYT